MSIREGAAASGETAQQSDQVVGAQAVIAPDPVARAEKVQAIQQRIGARFETAMDLATRDHVARDRKDSAIDSLADFMGGIVGAVQKVIASEFAEIRVEIDEVKARGPK